ncbi:hypothetical protein RJ640_007559 [Escallonia rubra]|uniref:Uncharacterized protein n=1 Tax=Escallonia rubra TaxID=112253 RepID=A0AA88RK29_9ASTE|nr:hypothetical protein RJ640_007559 [Escallonia rubra]
MKYLRFEVGSKGAALANTISNWVNVLLLAIYVKFSPACMETWIDVGGDCGTFCTLTNVEELEGTGCSSSSKS